jgi:hypothetical protein
MKILIVSDEESRGGAAISTSNLALGLLRSHLQIVRLVLSSGLNGDFKWRTVRFWNQQTFFNKLFIRSLNFIPFGIKKKLALKRFKSILESEKPDVINFHNILWGIDKGYQLEMYTEAAGYCETFVTMHDMWNIVGYPYELEKIEDKELLSGWKVPEEHLKGKTKMELIDLRTLIFDNINLFFCLAQQLVKKRIN